MSENYVELRFWDAYGIAEEIRYAVEEDPKNYWLESYFDTIDDTSCLRIRYPQRWTILHQLIEDWFLSHDVYGFEHHRNDMLDLIVTEYESILKGYEIAYPKFTIPSESDPQYESITQRIIADLRSLLPHRRIANETFQLLFGDRRFLIDLNQLVSRPISRMKVEEYPGLLKRDGVIQRQTLPIWAKRGVYYRDRGRCIHCGSDLTGTVITGEEVHFDHIVPLAKGGTNDPINFQLLCRGCNLQKGTDSYTSFMYPVYWDIED